MGRDKAALEWNGTTMLAAVVTALRSRVPRVIAVAAEGQVLPDLTSVEGVSVARDAKPGEGPLRGLEAGLAAAGEAGFARAFVAATDMPLLTGEVVSLLLREGRGDGGDPGVTHGPDVVIAVADGRDQPLAAVYRTDLAAQVAGVLAVGTRSLYGFLEGLDVVRVPLHGAGASAVFNVNTSEDVARASER